jgi:Domain of unknown function (DUF4406)
VRNVIYISGPMTGYADHNYPEFNRVESFLQDSFPEIVVVNPATLHPPGEHSREDCLRRDIKALCSCTDIYILEGWSKSEGAKIEIAVAKAIGVRLTYQSKQAEEEKCS